MNIEQILQEYPLRKVKPLDGMAITADLWAEAHSYHNKTQGLQLLFTHGAGILAGLDVIASDPPDSSVFIYPGVAVDPSGQVIVLPQPVTYDVGHEMEGPLYILLSYNEGRPYRPDKSEDESAPRFANAEFSITAHNTPPSTPYVELARVHRSSRNSVLINGPNPTAPGPDQLDLRFRLQANGPREASIAVCYLGEVADHKCGQGALHLAKAINYEGRYRMTVEDGATIGPGIVTKTLVYLVGQGDFELSGGNMNGLRNYVQRANGTLLIEALDDKATDIFTEFLRNVGFATRPVATGHRLLTNPFVFAAPPAGYETQGNLQCAVSDGVIFTTHKYGLLWQGERSGRSASREEIRAATEWGTNVIAYAEERRRLNL